MAVFPLLALPPEERLAFGEVDSAGLVPPESWARFSASWLWSRRLTEPPRPANAGNQLVLGKGRAKVSKGRSQSPLVVSEGRETVTCGGFAATPRFLPQETTRQGLILSQPIG